MRTAGVFAAVIAIVVVAGYFFLKSGAPATVATPAPASDFETRFNTLAGRVGTLETGLADLSTKVETAHKDMLAGLNKLGERFDAAVAVSSGLDAQMARLRAECPEATLKRYTFSKADPALEKRLLDHCKAVKEKELLAAPPAAAGPRVASRAPAAPATEEGEPLAEADEAPGVEIARDRIGAEPAMFRPGYGHGPRRGGPRCHGGGQWNPHFGKCMGPTRHIPISPENRAALGSCQDIQSRQVVRGNRLVTQQKGINCTHPGAMY